MTHHSMGAPFPLHAPRPDMIIRDIGSFETNDGMRLVLTDGSVVFRARCEGIDLEFGMGIDDFLVAIEQYTKANES